MLTFADVCGSALMGSGGALTAPGGSGGASTVPAAKKREGEELAGDDCKRPYADVC